jgi:hypothetical protein
MCSDGAGVAVVTFITGPGSSLNIYAQRIDANGTSKDSGFRNQLVDRKRNYDNHCLTGKIGTGNN